MRALFFFIVLFGCANAYSQIFIGEASIPKIEADGFYKIFLSPQIGPRLSSGFSNIRIYDQQNQEVPYLFQQESPVYYSPEFKEYEIIEKKQERNCCTSLMLRNPESHAINNISLSIKNAEVTKHASLVGSDDKQNWFALKQHFILTAIDNKNKTSEIKIVDFPLSNYNYYWLQIEDSTSAPLNILSAGYYKAITESGKYTEVPILRTLKSDSIKEKKSYVQIIFDAPQGIDKISLSMRGPIYYLRKATLYTKERRKNKKGKIEPYYDVLYSFEISSKQPSVIMLHGTRASELLVVVENEDNPALEIGSVKSYQLDRYLTAWLKKDNQYTVKLGDKDLQSPIYDLGFFKDRIPDQPPTLELGKITLFDKQEYESVTFFTDRSIIWAAIILVIALLGYMSMKLVRETGSAKH